MKTLYLAFLWHMHQPYYKDDQENRYLMPYAFLHSIKDYYDMLKHVSRHEKIKCTFNLTPSLLAQINDLSKNLMSDRLLYILSKDVSSLIENEKLFLLNNMFSVNYEFCIKPSERYNKLYEKFSKAADNIAESFSNDELLDLEVLYLLANCGYYLKNEDSFIQKLINKEQNYTQEEKERLIKNLGDFLSQLIPFYKSMKKNGQISITTSPFYHPILPILANLDNAKKAKENVVLPKMEYDFSSFADLQIKKAIQLNKELFGDAPLGFWPSEGSVSNDVVELFKENKIRYILTDEDILFKTIKTDDRSNIYKIYEKDGVNIFFRDKNLSNDISFKYNSLSAKDAVADFISHLQGIYNYQTFSPTVSVVMDGENAWEFYKNNGYDFFEELYTQLEKLDWCKTVTFDELLDVKDKEKETLKDIGTGSWIYGNFDVWIGKKEKNRAWELLSLTAKECDIDNDNVKNELMIAQGSDWFWWYDDDFYTPIKDKFDGLFRKHLINAYRLSGITPNHELFKPITKIEAKGHILKHKTPIIPFIDGKLTSAFEWLESPVLRAKPNNALFKTMRVCFDERFTYLSLLGDNIKRAKDALLEIDFPDKKIFNLKIPLKNQKSEWFFVAIDEFIEIRLNGKFEFEYAIIRIKFNDRIKEEIFFSEGML